MNARHGLPGSAGAVMITQPTPLDVLVASEDGAEPSWMLVVGWADGPDADHPVLPVAVPETGSAAPRVVYDPQGFRRPA